MSTISGTGSSSYFSKSDFSQDSDSGTSSSPYDSTSEHHSNYADQSGYYSQCSDEDDLNDLLQVCHNVFVKCIKDNEIQLIRVGINNKLISEPTSLLFEAMIYCRYEIFELILESGIEITLSKCKGLTLLHYAIKLWDREGFYIMEDLIRLRPDLVQEPTIGRKPPLHFAVYVSRNRNNEDLFIEIVNLLIQNHADPQEKDGMGNTPLHIAMQSRENLSPNLDVIEMLVQAGGDLNVENDKGQTPLDNAKRKNKDWYETPEVQLRLGALQNKNLGA